MDVVLLPLLGFDRRGTRLGIGGGYYDRSFAFLRERARPARAPAGRRRLRLPGSRSHLPAQPWDVPLDYVATERELIRRRPVESRNMAKQHTG